VHAGIAYVRWGPVWRRRGGDVDVDVFRQAVRALRNEFVCRRGLVLRMLPVAALDGPRPVELESALAHEGFTLREGTRSDTLVMDLAPPLTALRAGMRPHWKRYLNVALRNDLEVIEGSDDILFAAFLNVYGEMHSRKRFFDTNNIGQFRAIQRALPDELKMKVMLCRHRGRVCAGLVASTIGNTALYLFGATSNAGLASRGSYLLHWRVIEDLKARGIRFYDLNGINPAANPGTYRFKKDLGGVNGHELSFPGQLDASGNVLSLSCVALGDSLRSRYRSLKARKTRESDSSIRAVPPVVPDDISGKEAVLP
jgi:GNAT acetyltransferase-like protein